MLRRMLPLLVLAASCEPDVEDVIFDETAVQELFKTKDQGGTNGFFDYCDGATLCDQGEGDCDTDGQCSGGLSCVDNLGDNFGFSWTTDVCAPAHCANDVLDGDETAADFGGSCGAVCGGTLNTPDYCRPGCECAVGEGDCDVDADCDTGLVCGIDRGAEYGQIWSADVCVPSSCDNGVQDGGETGIDVGGSCGTCGGANGDQEGYCTPGCPCAYGEGDCDSNDECDVGLTCALDLGGRFGLDPLHDVCISSFAVTDLLPGDLVINEIMIDPVGAADSGGEWFEIFNPLNADIDLNGLHVQDSINSQKFTVGVSLILPANGYLLFARTGNPLTNGNLVEDYDYLNVFSLSNTTDTIILKTADGGTTIDSVTYSTASGWTVPAGASIELGAQHKKADNNNLSTSWCTSIGTGVPSGDNGTPGAANRICP